MHRSLRAIDNNILLSRLEPHMTASPDDIIVPESELIRPFEMWPQVTDNTHRLLNDCSLGIDFTTHKNKKDLLGKQVRRQAAAREAGMGRDEVPLREKQQGGRRESET